MSESARDAEDYVDRFRALYTGFFVDAIGAIGRDAGILPPEIAPLDRRMRIAGPAYTIVGRLNPDAARKPTIEGILEMLGAVPAGHVAVYQTNDDVFAHFGEMAATALKAGGCAGVITDGGCRDIARLLDMEFPVFCNGVIPRDSFGGWEIVETGGSAMMEEVSVETGDYIVADADGVVVIPQDVRDEVLERAETAYRSEEQLRKEMLAGVPPLEVFRRHGLV